MLILELDPRSFAQSDAHDFWILDPIIWNVKLYEKARMLVQKLISTTYNTVYIKNKDSIRHLIFF